MNTRNSLFQLLLLAMTASASGQALPTAPEAQSAPRLDLSLPGYAAAQKTPAAIADERDAAAMRHLQPSAGGGQKDESGATRLPYGAGFERRQQGPASGGGGRGGMGRGR